MRKFLFTILGICIHSTVLAQQYNTTDLYAECQISKIDALSDTFVLGRNDSFEYVFFQDGQCFEFPQGTVEQSSLSNLGLDPIIYGVSAAGQFSGIQTHYDQDGISFQRIPFVGQLEGGVFQFKRLDAMNIIINDWLGFIPKYIAPVTISSDLHIGINLQDGFDNLGLAVADIENGLLMLPDHLEFNDFVYRSNDARQLIGAVTSSPHATLVWDLSDCLLYTSPSPRD